MLKVSASDLQVDDIIYTYDSMRLRVTKVTSNSFCVVYLNEELSRKVYEYGFNVQGGPWNVVRPPLILLDLAGVVHG